jgi:hypothetical protein
VKKELEFALLLASLEEEQQHGTHNISSVGVEMHESYLSTHN